jgi:hypothetical protein
MSHAAFSSPPSTLIELSGPSRYAQIADLGAATQSSTFIAWYNERETDAWLLSLKPEVSFEETHLLHRQLQPRTSATALAATVPADWSEQMQRRMQASAAAAEHARASAAMAEAALKESIMLASNAACTALRADSKMKADVFEWNALRAACPLASIGQSFHTDGLLCIFSFLSLRELPKLLCCRAWLTAASKEKGRGVQWNGEFGLPDKLLWTCGSVLRHHFSRLVLDINDDVTLAQWRIVQRQLSHVTSLSVSTTGSFSQSRAQASSSFQYMYMNSSPEPVVFAIASKL